MPPFGPISRQQLIRSLRKAGFEGPYSGGSHQYLVKDELKLSIPDPHKGEISRTLLAKLLVQAGIAREEWEE